MFVLVTQSVCVRVYLCLSVSVFVSACVCVCVCLCLCVKDGQRLTQEDDVHAGIRLHRVLDRRKMHSDIICSNTDQAT